MVFHYQIDKLAGDVRDMGTTRNQAPMQDRKCRYWKLWCKETEKKKQKQQHIDGTRILLLKDYTAEGVPNYNIRSQAGLTAASHGISYSLKDFWRVWHPPRSLAIDSTEQKIKWIVILLEVVIYDSVPEVVGWKRIQMMNWLTGWSCIELRTVTCTSLGSCTRNGTHTSLLLITRPLQVRTEHYVRLVV